jgi:hypothetical protein
MLEERQREEDDLAKFINDDAGRRAKYGTILSEIAGIYEEMERNAEREFVLQYLTRSSDALRISSTIYEAAVERRKPDVERESAYMDRNWKQTADRLLLSLKNFHAPVDRVILADLFERASRLASEARIKAVDDALTGLPDAAAFAERAYSKTRIADETFVKEMLARSQDALAGADDPFLGLAVALYPESRQLKEIEKRRTGDLTRLYALYLDAKREFLGAQFIPDANSTLRLTFGRIKSYRPADALVAYPITTLGGVIEKHTGKDPFDAPEALLDLHRKKDFGRFAHPELKDVPVAFLYDADTTGGNSGSPVLNAGGRLVGVNFDRAWEATINDYGWSPLYSRSIAVDIRYVLWITLKIGKAEGLLRELGVEY